jgi:hypothetical protein
MRLEQYLLQPKEKNAMKRKLYIITLLLLSCLNWATALQAREVPRFQRTYVWEYEGDMLRFQYAFPWETYDFYASRPRTFGNYAVYTYENPQNQLLEDFVEGLRCLAEEKGYDHNQTLGMVIAFVQNLEYQPELGEYPKFPVETLAERGGDCEDTSILLASMLRLLGEKAVLVNPPRHMAVALACDSCSGTEYLHEGKSYFYVETTAPNYRIGQVPEKYLTSKDNIYGLEAKDEEKWMLASYLPNPKATARIYFVEEDEITHYAEDVDGNLLKAKAIIRSVNVEGKVSRSRRILLNRPY